MPGPCCLFVGLRRRAKDDDRTARPVLAALADIHGHRGHHGIADSCLFCRSAVLLRDDATVVVDERCQSRRSNRNARSCA
jgi:hypothetical protein